MKRTTLAADLVLGTLSAAVPSLALADAAMKGATCTILGQVADLIVQKREDNVPMSDMLDLTAGDATASAIVRDAYTTPLYVTEDDKLQAPLVFTNAAQAVCWSRDEAEFTE
jgi:hypothetical protein